MANTERSGEEDILVGDDAVPLRRSEARIPVGSTGLWVSHKLVAGLRPNQFLLAPPAKLVVVSLWWAEEFRFKPTGVLPAKRPFL